MRNITPFLIGSILLTLVACQKEQSVDTLNGAPGAGGSTGGTSSGNGSEKGTWKFLSMRGITSSTAEYNLSGDNIKTVTLSDYTTVNNDGTVKFDGATMTGTGLAYSVHDTYTGYFYTNGSLDDTLDIPFDFSVPPTNSTASYKKIKSDSIYVQSGGFTIVGTTGTTAAAEGGYKLAWEGDKMTMTYVFDDSKIQFNQGISMKMTQHMVQIMTLQKQ